MVGITLTPEQVRSAPPDVRRWLEQELATSLGLRPRQPEREEPRHEHLVACSVEEVTAILRVIQEMLPVVNVFFELGRHGANFADEGLAAFRLVDILHHTRLQNIDQVMGCLRLINAATQQIRGDTSASLYAIDKDGDCFVAAQTQQSILRLWLQVVGGQVLHAAADAGDRMVAGPGPVARPPAFTQGEGGQPDSESRDSRPPMF